LELTAKDLLKLEVLMTSQPQAIPHGLINATQSKTLPLKRTQVVPVKVPSQELALTAKASPKRKLILGAMVSQIAMEPTESKVLTAAEQISAAA